METIIKAIAVYGILLALFRITGKRTLAEVTPFDLVLLLIISEATQTALVGDDDSMMNAFLLVGTLIGLNMLLAALKSRSKTADHVLDSAPLLIVENGQPIEEHMRMERIDVDDVLDAARETQGIGRLEDIRYAVLERNGRISIVPRDGAGA